MTTQVVTVSQPALHGSIQPALIIGEGDVAEEKSENWKKLEEEKN